MADTSIEEYEQDPDAGITGVIAPWKDKASNKSGEELADTSTAPKRLTHVYATKSSAKHAAKLEWANIQERRDVIAENAADN